MDFKIITQQQAEEIAYQWHYDGKYAFYDMDTDEENLINGKARLRCYKRFGGDRLFWT
ncbi:hypothetical protein SAMN04488072_11322 [Lentibacillus halodurans]|uniref:Uncharacterized protein n=1 Tax=Lentibacillus halodurans TaxID=237679 RepID=A0A1I0ZS54_9BACI|nr:hypothetical protein [Lentibacillus halodurans]SFB28367.1 hypothetical protein SAMN04488072_11322 [Lentibacillus halodurans]